MNLTGFLCFEALYALGLSGFAVLALVVGPSANALVAVMIGAVRVVGIVAAWVGRPWGAKLLVAGISAALVLAAITCWVGDADGGTWMRRVGFAALWLYVAREVLAREDSVAFLSGGEPTEGAQER